MITHAEEDDIEKYIINHSISNYDLYNDSFGKNPLYSRTINIKVYSLLRDIRKINFPCNEITINYIASYIDMVEIWYEYKRHKALSYNNEYGVLRPKMNIIKFCKNITLFLDSLLAIHGGIQKSYYCFGDRCTTQKHNELYCLRKILDNDQLEHMLNIKTIANTTHNFPATVIDIANLHIFVNEGTVNSELLQENGAVYYIKRFGNIDYLYEKSIKILIEILSRTFGVSDNVNKVCIKLWQLSLMYVMDDINNLYKLIQSKDI